MCAPNCEENNKNITRPKTPHRMCNVRAKFNPRSHSVLGRRVGATGHGISGGISGARLGRDSAVTNDWRSAQKSPALWHFFHPWNCSSEPSLITKCIWRQQQRSNTELTANSSSTECTRQHQPRESSSTSNSLKILQVITAELSQKYPR